MGVRYPMFAAACAALAFLAVLKPDRIPSGVQRLITVSHNLERENAPPPGAYYPNCTSARAAGVAPIYAGEPGYRPELDADDDGIACEPYRGV
jgi:excalibur calcium-binding domain-containing protein